MNGRTAKLLNRYTSFVVGKISEGKNLAPLALTHVRRQTRKQVFDTWKTASWKERTAMRRRLKAEMARG